MYTSRNKPISKKISILLSIIMVVTMMPMGALAEGPSSQLQIGDYFKVSQGDGEILDPVEMLGEGNTQIVEKMTKHNGDEIDALWMNKTIEGTDEENVFDITLAVETMEDLDELVKSPDAAVVLVMDVSSSMKWDLNGNTTNNNSNRRITKAKAGAKAFIDSFAGGADGADRWLSIVQFGSDASRLMDWTNVAVGNNKVTAKNQIEGITINDNVGTNIEGGLLLAHNNMKAFKQSSNYPTTDNVYIIMLTDGVPTFHVSSSANRSSLTFIAGVKGGGNVSTIADSEPVYSKYNNPNTGVALDITKDNITLYSIAYATGNVTVKVKERTQGSNYKTVDVPIKNWLGYFSNRVFEAGENIGLVFESIAQLISMSVEAWTVTDPLPEYMIFDVDDSVNVASHIALNGNSYRRYEEADHQLVWDLKNDTPTKTGNIYKYQLKYRVRLNPLHVGVIDGQLHPANEATSLKYFFKEEVIDANGNVVEGSSEERTSYFNIPSVKGLYGSFEFDKVAYHNDAIPVSGAVFNLINESNEDHVISAVSGANGKVSFNNIPSGSYTMEEVSLPAGSAYEVSGVKYDVEVAWGQVVLKDEKGDAVNPAELKFKNKLKQIPINIEVEKVWLSPSNCIVPIKIQLVQKASAGDEGNVILEKVLGESPWKHTFKNVPKINQETGNDWIYEVKETKSDGSQLDNFTTTVTGNKNDGFVVTNLINQEKITVTAKKQWQTYEGDNPPSVTVTLHKNGVATNNTKVLSSNNNWTANFTELDQYDEQGQIITYAVHEAVPDGYSKESELTEGNITTFVNRINNEEIVIEGEKTWADEDGVSQRPAQITVELWRDGIKLMEKEVSASNSWKYKFESDNEIKLKKFKEALGNDGKVQKHSYIIKEVGVDGYVSVVDGYNIKNTLTGKTSVSGNKVWIDLPGFEGEHPNVTINLLKNGAKIDSVVLGHGETSFEFSNLDKYDGNGKLFVYTISENPVEGYSGKCDQESFTVTNTAVLDDETSLSGQKIWRQPSDVDKPAITVYLLQDGQRMDNKSKHFPANSADYNYSFENLPKYHVVEVDEEVVVGEDEEGNDIVETVTKEEIVPYVYSVEEINISGYNTSYEGNNIINTIKGNTTIKGSKKWNEPAGILHDPVTIQLWKKLEDASGSWEFTGETATVTDSNKNFSFTAPLYNGEGKRYEYTVREVAVNGYSTQISKAENGEFVVTNTMNQQYKRLAGVKTWIDPDGTNHNDITIRLKQNGVEVASVTLGNGETAYTFINGEEGSDGLWPVYDANWNQYNYTVSEDPVAGYNTSINGLDVTNTIVQDGSLSYEVSKIWVAPADMVHPSIEITLWKTDSKGVKSEVDSYILNNGEKKHTFTGLDKYDEYGKPYAYSVTENDVPGYTSEVAGPVIKNIIDQKYIDVIVYKEWDDGNDEIGPIPMMMMLSGGGSPIVGNRDKVTFQLLADGNPVEGRVIDVTADDGWVGVFEDLPKYTEVTRAEIVYSVQEIEVPGYRTEYGTPYEDQGGNIIIEVTNIARDYYYIVWRHYTTIHNGVPGAETIVEGELVKGSYNDVITQASQADEAYKQFGGNTYNYISDKGEPSITLLNAGEENAAILHLYYERTTSGGGGGDGGSSVYKYQVIRHYGTVDGDGNVSYTDKVEESVVTLSRAERNALPDHKVTVDGNSSSYRNYGGNLYTFQGDESTESVVLERANTLYKLDLYYLLEATTIPDEDVPLGPGDEDGDGTVTIPDEQPPLGDKPGTTVIPDEKVPLDGSPRTDDPTKTNMLYAYMVALVIAGLGAAASAWGFGRRREEETE